MADPNQPPYGTPDQPPYGAQQPYAYGAPQPPYGVPLVPDHPQANTVLVLGILGLVVCGLCAPFAWVMGNRVLREVDAAGGRLGGRSNANAGRILGIIGTCLVGASLLFLTLVLAAVVLGAASSTT